MDFFMKNGLLRKVGFDFRTKPYKCLYREEVESQNLEIPTILTIKTFKISEK